MKFKKTQNSTEQRSMAIKGLAKIRKSVWILLLSAWFCFTFFLILGKEKWNCKLPIITSWFVCAVWAFVMLFDMWPAWRGLVSPKVHWDMILLSSTWMNRRKQMEHEVFLNKMAVPLSSCFFTLCFPGRDESSHSPWSLTTAVWSLTAYWENPNMSQW